jgi:hypothetical protein
LLFASRYISELVVLLVGCEEIKTERALDSIESNVRRNLSECGFDGNSATILRAARSALNKTGVKALLAALDEKNLTIEPRAAPTKLPAKHPNGPLAEVLLQVKALARVSGRATLTASTEAKLLKGPITTQFGGAPYLEEEPSPVCKGCKQPMIYLFQLDAKNHLRPAMQGAGLYVFYECFNYTHMNFSQMRVLHYKDPSPEKRLLVERPTAMDGPELEPFSVEVRYVSELPSLYQESLPPELWKKLGKLTPKKREGAWLTEITKLLNVEAAAFNDDRVGRISFGGYAAASEGYATEIPVCKKCKQEMRVLASVGYNPRLGFADDWRAADLQFFVCACRPSTAETVMITPDDDYMMGMRYEVSFE